jgi:hypothetical protein
MLRVKVCKTVFSRNPVTIERDGRYLPWNTCHFLTLAKLVLRYSPLTPVMLSAILYTSQAPFPEVAAPLSEARLSMFADFIR